MSQVFVAPGKIVGDRFSLDSLEAHHVLRVLRKVSGDKLTFFDGRGRRFEGSIDVAQSSLNRVEGTVVRWLEPESPQVGVVLVQGLPRGSKWDYVIEKATELGVDAIVPFIGETSPIEIDERAVASKEERWNRLAQAAAKQCDRSSVPLVHAPHPLVQLASVLSSGTILVCSTGSDVRSIKDVLSSTSREGRVHVVVGPESGFSVQELRWLEQQGAHLIGLGRLTLRTETAGLVAVTVVRHVLGEI